MHFPGPMACGSSAMRPLLRYGPEKQRWLTNILEQVYLPLAEPEREPLASTVSMGREATRRLTFNRSDANAPRTDVSGDKLGAAGAPPRPPTPGSE